MGEDGEGAAVCGYLTSCLLDGISWRWYDIRRIPYSADFWLRHRPSDSILLRAGQDLVKRWTARIPPCCVEEPCKSEEDSKRSDDLHSLQVLKLAYRDTNRLWQWSGFFGGDGDEWHSCTSEIRSDRRGQVCRHLGDERSSCTEKMKMIVMAAFARLTQIVTSPEYSRSGHDNVVNAGRVSAKRTSVAWV